LLRQLEAKAGKSSSSPALRPLGKFLCPVCNQSQVISRLGVTVLPPVQQSSEDGRCSAHLSLLESYCYNCNKQLCSHCLTSHSRHHVEDMDTVKYSLDTTLRSAVREIMERMETIEKDISRIRSVREKEGEQRRRVRREVVTYYEGYLTHVNKHQTDLEKKINLHHDNCSNLLLKEEVTLEQYRIDLRGLCSQIENILRMGDCEEMVRRMRPVARKLERLSEEIMNSGDLLILNRLQFIPRTLSQGDIPGFLSTFSVCQTASYAVIDRPVYEKVLCTIPLYLADDNGLKLDVYHDLDISAMMTLYSKEDRQVEMVEVTVQSLEGPGWSLTFCPPQPGIAHLSVMVSGKHIRHSPYVINILELSLDEEYIKTSLINQNVYRTQKKSVSFETKYTI